MLTRLPDSSNGEEIILVHDEWGTRHSVGEARPICLVRTEFGNFLIIRPSTTRI